MSAAATNVTVLSDRMDEVSAAMDEPWRFRHNPPDFAFADSMGRFVAWTAVLEYLLRRYSAAAPPNCAIGRPLDAWSATWAPG